MLVSGAVPFKTRKERRKIYDQLKKEYSGKRIEILIENNLITYACHVNRKEIF